MQKVLIRTYGAAKTNPGAAVIAVQVADATGKILSETVESIGNATDVFAAFTAVARGLDMAQQEFGEKTSSMAFTLTLSNIEVKQQLNSELPITNPGIVPHFIEIHNLRVASFPNLTLSLNKKKTIEKLVSEALDGK